MKLVALSGEPMPLPAMDVLMALGIGLLFWGMLSGGTDGGGM